MEEKHLYDLPKDMLIKIIMTIQDCKNLNDDDLIRNSKTNILEVEKRKFKQIKEFLLKEDLEKSLNLSKLINDIDYIKCRVVESNFIVRMSIMFKDNTTIRIIQLDVTRMTLYDENNFQLCGLYNDVIQFAHEKYKDHIALYQQIIFPHFQKIYKYLSPFTPIDSF